MIAPLTQPTADWSHHSPGNRKQSSDWWHRSTMRGRVHCFLVRRPLTDVLRGEPASETAGGASSCRLCSSRMPRVRPTVAAPALRADTAVPAFRVPLGAAAASLDSSAFALRVDSGAAAAAARGLRAEAETVAFDAVAAALTGARRWRVGVSDAGPTSSRTRLFWATDARRRRVGVVAGSSDATSSARPTTASTRALRIGIAVGSSAFFSADCTAYCSRAITFSRWAMFSAQWWFVAICSTVSSRPMPKARLKTHTWRVRASTQLRTYARAWKCVMVLPSRQTAEAARQQ